jgi:hypothetical protein
MLSADYLSNNWDIIHVDRNIATFRPTLCSYLLNGLLNPILDSSDQSQYERMQCNCNSPLLVIDFYKYKNILKNNYRKVINKDLFDLLITLINHISITQSTYETYLQTTHRDKFLKKWLDKLPCPSKVTLANISNLANCRIFVYKSYADNPHSYDCQEIYDFSSYFQKDIFLLLDPSDGSYSGLIKLEPIINHQPINNNQEIIEKDDISGQRFNKKRKNADENLLSNTNNVMIESRRSKTQNEKRSKVEEDEQKKVVDLWGSY